MLITYPIPMTNSSKRLRVPTCGFDLRGVVSIEGGRAAAGTALSTYDVPVPASVKGGAFPGVRAWSPPV